MPSIVKHHPFPLLSLRSIEQTNTHRSPGWWKGSDEKVLGEFFDFLNFLPMRIKKGRKVIRFSASKGVPNSDRYAEKPRSLRRTTERMEITVNFFWIPLRLAEWLVDLCAEPPGGPSPLMIRQKCSRNEIKNESDERGRFHCKTST